MSDCLRLLCGFYYCSSNFFGELGVYKTGRGIQIIFAGLIYHADMINLRSIRIGKRCVYFPLL